MHQDHVLMNPQGDIISIMPGARTSTQFAGMNTFGDFTGDGRVEVFGGTSVYDLSGNELIRTIEENERGHTMYYAPIADLNGDGRREMLTYLGFVDQRGHYRCRVDERRAWFHLLDVDADGRPEVLVLFAPDERGQHRLAILGSDCAVMDEVVFSEVVPNPAEILSMSTGPLLITMIAPFLERDRPSFVVSFSRRHSDTGRFIMGKGALFDHELNFIQEMNMDGFRGSAIAADLNGDGLYELIVTSWRDDNGEPIMGPAVVEPSSGIITLLDDVDDVGSYLVYADIDGDGRGEIVANVRDHDGQRYIRAYKGAGPGFAAAWPFEYHTQAPYLHNPDGTPSQEPVRYDRLAMFNAMPSGGWWVGMNSDLRVRFTDVCEADCPEGSLTFTVQVGNHGYGDVGNDVIVRIYGERGAEQTLLAEQRYRDVNAGQWNEAEPITVRFQGEPFDRLRAVVAGDGYDVQECDTDNNEAIWNLSCR